MKCFLAAVSVTKLFAADVCIFRDHRTNQGVAFKNKKQFGNGFMDTNKRTSMWCVSVSSQQSELGNFGFKQIKCELASRIFNAVWLGFYMQNITFAKDKCAEGKSGDDI